MTRDLRWTPIAEYGASYEAELAAGILRDAGIPVLVQGPEVGIFGPGFSGPTSRGVRILVPVEMLEEARDLLDPGEGEMG